MVRFLARVTENVCLIVTVRAILITYLSRRELTPNDQSPINGSRANGGMSGVVRFASWVASSLHLNLSQHVELERKEMGSSMFAKIMKWVSITGLLLVGFWHASASYQLALEFVVCISAIMIVVQAAGDGKYVWAMGFVALALLFNPIQPIKLSTGLHPWIELLAVAMFLVSLIVLKTRPVFSMQSITERVPRTHAL
jgi:hypothetical protein